MPSMPPSGGGLRDWPDSPQRPAPMAAAVLDQIDLNDKIVTTDALHTMKATATHIHERGREFTEHRTPRLHT